MHMKPGMKVIIDGHAGTIVSISKYHLFVYFEDGTDYAMRHATADRMRELGRMVDAQAELLEDEGRPVVLEMMGETPSSEVDPPWYD
jgi:hypothetical protein